MVSSLFNGTPLHDEEGKKIGSFAMITDITQRKQAERDLARNQRLAEQEIVSVELLDQVQSRRDVRVQQPAFSLAELLVDVVLDEGVPEPEAAESRGAYLHVGLLDDLAHSTCAGF